jgi:hypothetical protein
MNHNLTVDFRSSQPLINNEFMNMISSVDPILFPDIPFGFQGEKDRRSDDVCNTNDFNRKWNKRMLNLKKKKRRIRDRENNIL